MLLRHVRFVPVSNHRPLNFGISPGTPLFAKVRLAAVSPVPVDVAVQIGGSGNESKETRHGGVREQVGHAGRTRVTAACTGRSASCQTPEAPNSLERLEVIIPIVDHCEERTEPLCPGRVAVLRPGASRRGLADHDRLEGVVAVLLDETLDCLAAGHPTGGRCCLRVPAENIDTDPVCKSGICDPLEVV